MKKLLYLIVAIVALGLIVSGCIPVVPPTEQDVLGSLEMTSVSKNGVTPIVIDGTLSPGEWDSYFWFIDNTEGPGTGYDDDPLPVFSGYLHFDDTNLYLAFDVVDNTPNTNRDFLYITIDIPLATIFYNPIDALYWGSIPANPSFFGEAYLTGDPFPWDRSQRASTWGTVGGVVTARTITATNRCYELQIPLTAISASLGDTIGLKIQARDGDYPTFQYANFFPDMPDGITPIRADTRVEVEGNFYQLFLTPPDEEGPVTLNVAADPNPAPVGNTINLTATINDTDTGGSNIASAEYSLNSGADWESMNAVDDSFDSPVEAVVAIIGPFAESQVVEILVRGTDAAGNVGEQGYVLLAVYDPTAGFVTGGGWIDSPEGAYAANPGLTGKAIFGFVSKYKKGATVPTGNTEFQFKAGDLNFHSDTYDWLVIAGPKAMYKGTGTVNSAGAYGFMLSAIDGQLNGGGGTDKFRIKIWDKDTDNVIYDNKLDGDDDLADPTTEIGGGQIVIHKGK